MDLEAVIGLEVHARVATKSKMFCTCSNDIFDAAPNTHTCPICMGFPGMLPVLNHAVLENGLRAALALQCTILPEMKFDRKNYFYPDLPKGYQISQYDVPLSQKGMVEIMVGDTAKKIGITRLHLEDDAGKSTHTAGGTQLDFNRCGTPLMEIVTDPDFRSAEEAEVFARELQTILRTVGASYADMEKGMMRFDASVSLRPRGEAKLYPRAEIKNLNSFKSLREAVTYEIARQTKLWESGTPMTVQCTVGWREQQGKTVFLREKETASDYRYFPEPDLPPFTFDTKTVESVRATLPELPAMKRARFIEQYGISRDHARIISLDPALTVFFEEAAAISKNPSATANWVTVSLLGLLNERGMTLEDTHITPQSLGTLIALIDSGTLSGKNAKEVFDELVTSGGDPAAIVASKGLQQVSNPAEIEKICKDVIINNGAVADQYRSGKEKALTALIGKVMAATKGTANPKLVTDMLKKLLS